LRRQLRWQLSLEWALLQHEWPWILGIVVVVYLLAAACNLVYYVLTLVISRYFSYHRFLLALASVILALLVFSLIIFRFHYTADVVTALYVTMGGWFLMPQEPVTLNKYWVTCQCFDAFDRLYDHRY